MRKELIFGIFLFALPGCTTALSGNGKIGFAQQTSWYIYHETTDTDEKEHSKASLSFDKELFTASEVSGGE